VAVKHIFVEDEAKRRQMQKELNLLHAFNSKPLQQKHDLGDVLHLGRDHPINLLQHDDKSNSLTDSSSGQHQQQHEEKKSEDELLDESKPSEGFGAHVVSIYDAYSDKADRSVCLVLEYMSGGSLESFVKEVMPPRCPMGFSSSSSSFFFFFLINVQ
jgi:serine/threonine protein kinase